ncbi:MAG: phosphoribosyltransferase [Acidobacteriota bacterium]
MSNELAKVITGEIDRAVAALDTMCDGVPRHVEDAPTARMLPFANRFAAGRLLGRALDHHKGSDALVLGLACGGLVVGEGVVDEIGLQLDTWLARRLVSPVHPGLVLGAISEGSGVVVDRAAIATSELSRNQLRALAKDAAEEMAADARRYRRGRGAPPLRGRTAILCDEAVLTGATLAAAIGGVRKRGAARVIVATPVGAADAIGQLRELADEVVCLAMPERLRRVGAWYTSFHAIGERTVVRILDHSGSQNGAAGRAIA